MPVIKRILFPVDFSANCLGAARYVEALAARFEAEILLLHVVGRGEHNLAEELLPQRQAQLGVWLADDLKYFETIRRCVVSEDPAAEIIQAARQWKPDLVMMPTSGLGMFQRLVLGSVTAKVLQAVECPVWTSVHAEAAPPLEAIHCRKVLCAVGLSERSQGVLEWAAWLAGQHDARLAIVHATTEIPASFDGGRVEEELMQTMSGQARERMEGLQLAAGTASEVFYETGEPGDVVPRTALKFGADLVVAGRREESDLDVFRDSYAILRRSPCPVISL